jgi:hypothetical protein
MPDIPVSYRPQSEGRRNQLEMNVRSPRGSVSVLGMLAAVACLSVLTPAAEAQITPAAGYTPPDDTPSIKLGTTIFADDTYQAAPTVKDADGNSVYLSAFNVSRAYINLTGNISHLVGFRVTGDVSRETGTGSSLTGSLTYRLKYAFMSVNLDDWIWKGSWVRFGIQHTPLIDYEEQIYRYRFQGTVFAEREGYLTSSDAAVSFHTAFPGNYGDFHVGYYNGDGYSKAEPNDQKAIQIRGSFRPAPLHVFLRGLRVTGFYDDDHNVLHGPRMRALFETTFEHKYVSTGFDYLATRDQTSVSKAAVDGRGWSFWATPRFGRGFEALLRHDSMKRDTSPTYENQVNERTIVGLAYWFPRQGNVSSALLLDYDQYKYVNYITSQPAQQRWAVHCLVQF